MLLHDLSEAGYDDEKLDSMEGLIDARDSDVHDVLAFAVEAHTRQQRVDTARRITNAVFANYKQQ